MRALGRQKVGHVRLAASPPARTARSATRSRKLLDKGAEGIVLDLRDNGGGLLNEAVLVASIFIPEGTIVSTKGRSRPERVYEATGGAIPTQGPGRRARQPRVRVGLGDRHRRAAGPRPRDGRRHAHVRQGRLPGGRAALQRRRARHHRRRVLHCPAGATSAAAASKKGAGITPDVKAAGRPDRPSATRRSTSRAARRRVSAAGDASTRRRAAARSSPCSRSAAASSPRRRSSTAGAASTSTSRARDGARPGDLVLVRRPGRGGGPRARSCGGIGRPDVARDVIEALMLDRGLRRRFDPRGRARGARGRRAAARGDAGPRRDLRDAADVHDRPADRARLRRRDLRRGARRRRDPRVGPHRRRLRLRAARLAGRPRGLPARHERLRPRRGRADAARGALQRRLLARARRRTASRSPSSSSSTARRSPHARSTAR